MDWRTEYNGERHRLYSNYFRDIFGERVQKLSVNAGFTCPNRDGTISTGGCSFCNNSAFSPSYCQSHKSVKQQIEEGIEFHQNRYRKATKYLAYFQSFSNTYKPLEELRAIYQQAFSIDGVVGVVIGTRPDCIDDEKLSYFQELSKEHYVMIEYGVESCYDSTLKAINRGHDFATARRAIERTADFGIPCGAHFILGLPGETKQMMIDSVDIINSLPLSTVKFHQLQLFKDTIMAEEFVKNPEKFSFFETEEYIDFFIEILIRLRPDIVVERFAGEAPPRFHFERDRNFVRNEQVLQMFRKRIEERDVYQGMLYVNAGDKSL